MRIKRRIPTRAPFPERGIFTPIPPPGDGGGNGYSIFQSGIGMGRLPWPRPAVIPSYGSLIYA